MKKIIIFSAVIAGICISAADIVTIKITSNRKDYFFTPQKNGTYWIVSSAKSLIPAGQQHFGDLRLDNGPQLTRRLLPYNRTEANAQLERVILQGGKKYKFYFKYDKKQRPFHK